MTHLGLFEGIGGFSLAARWAGWETIAWCEWNEFGQRVLRHHFPNAIGHGDITKTDFTIYANKIDVLTGGFPCQPYSTAGKRLGKDDERHLWPEMLRAIREIAPRWVVGENVRGLVSWNGGLVFDEVQADLEASGYEVLPFILPACAKDAPHRRDRVWFVAHAINNGLEYTFQNRSENEIFRTQNAKRQNNNTEQPKSTETNGLRRSFANAGFERLEGSASGRIPQVKRAKRQSRECGEFTGLCRGYWQNFPTQSPIRGGNDGFSAGLDGITFSKWRNESIKAYGNAIVPQVAYEIFKAINAYEEMISSNK